MYRLLIVEDDRGIARSVREQRKRAVYFENGK